MIALQFDINPRAITKLYNELPDAIQRRVIRRALESGVQPMVQALRREVRQHKTKDSTGVLGNSIGAVARTNKINHTTLIRIGALRKPAVQVPLKTQRAGKRYFVTRRPSRYFHLSDKRRDGKERVQRIFYSLRHSVAALIVEKLEAGLIRETNKLYGGA